MKHFFFITSLSRTLPMLKFKKYLHFSDLKLESTLSFPLHIYLLMGIKIHDLTFSFGIILKKMMKKYKIRILEIFCN